MTTPTRTPRGCSPWALIGCGCGFAAMVGLLFIFLLLSVIRIHERTNPVWNRADYNECVDNIHYLGRALDSYRTDYRHFPARLSDLAPRYLDRRARLHCPLEGKGLGSPYQYFPEGKNPTDPLIICANHGQDIIILLRNGKFKIPDKREKQRK